MEITVKLSKINTLFIQRHTDSTYLIFIHIHEQEYIQLQITRYSDKLTFLSVFTSLNFICVHVYCVCACVYTHACAVGAMYETVRVGGNAYQTGCMCLNLCLGIIALRHFQHFLIDNFKLSILPDVVCSWYFFSIYNCFQNIKQFPI